jgi:hypothetical protein
VAALLVTWPASAMAQSPGEYQAVAIANVATAAGGDLGSNRLTASVALAVFEPDGWGAEVDLGQTRSGDGGPFLSGGLTSFTINVARAVMRGRVRPFVAAGGGLLRVPLCGAGCGAPGSRTDWVLDAAGGVTMGLSDRIGVRGEVRYFRFLGSHPDLPGTTGAFDFWRTSVGVSFGWPLGW